MNTIRSLPLIAALLLGTSTLQALAQEAPPAPLAAPQPAGHLIERFGLVTGSVVQPGREVRYVLYGQPGGRAWVDIPGSQSGIPLVEMRPGLYQGGYVVSPGDNLNSVSRAFGGLQVGGVTTTTQANGFFAGYVAPPPPPQLARPVEPPRVVEPPRPGREVDRRDDRRESDRRDADRRAPQISELSPAQGERVSDRRRTRISARVEDRGAGIDRRSLQVRVDGRDVTRHASFDGEYVDYLEDLDRGRHTVEIVVRDRNGNASRAAWSFEVEGRRR